MELDDEAQVDTRTMEVIDTGLLWPVGFVWFSKPRIRVKAISRKRVVS